MINPESKRPVNLEDLLRLKRAERPPAGFWEEFDRELRAKQLAALVEKRPWWRRLPRTFVGAARYHLPLGATAVLAVTLLSIRDYRPVEPAYVAANETESAPAAAAPNETAASAVIDAPAVSASPESTTPASAGTATTVTEPDAVAATQLPAPTPVEAPVPGALTRMVPMLTDAQTTPSLDVRPSARSIAENRAVAAALLGTTSGFETRVLPVRQAPQEPLAQMANPAETRRSRFAAAFASMVVDTSTATSARVARRLSDEQLYDQIHRFGASGNSVSFKF